MPKKSSAAVITAQIDAIRAQRGRSWVEKWRAIARLIIAHLGGRKCLFKTSVGTFLFIEQTGKLVLLNDKSPSPDLKGYMEAAFGINFTERGFKYVVNALETEAFRAGRQIPVYRLSHFDVAHTWLYVSRFDGWMYRLDGQQRVLLRNGSDGVFFKDDESWAPYEPACHAADVFDRHLINSIPFDATVAVSPAHARLLWKAWMLAVFFPELIASKPIAVFSGEKGSGKSMAQRAWLKSIFGEDAEVSSVEGVKQDGLIAALTMEPVVCLDNVDCGIKWLPNVLAGCATGTQFAKRALYTTNDLVRFKTRAFLMLNTRTTEFLMRRDDIADRSLIFNLTRLPSFSPESVVLSAIQRDRFAVWGQLLSMLTAVVKSLHDEQLISVTPFRMADFAVFATTVSKALGSTVNVEDLLEHMKSAQASFLLDDDPLLSILEEWTKDETNWCRELTAGELCDELRTVGVLQGLRFEYVNGQSLGQKLSHCREFLSTKFEVNVLNDSNGHQKRYRFRPRLGGMAESGNGN